MKQENINLTLVFCFCLLNFQAVWAQYRVSGQLVNKNEEALRAATIMLTRGDSLVAGGMSDEKGSFSIEGLPGGSYLLRLSLIGYKDMERALNVENNLKLGMIRMEEETYALEGVTVTGNRADLVERTATGEIFHLSEKMKGEARNIYQALREIPLLSVNETDRAIRMADGSTPIILVNGVRRSGAEEVIDPEMIETVEVIENPSARYLAEEGVTAVLNIRTRRSRELAQSANLYGKQQANGAFGLLGGSYQMEKSNLSFYLNGQFFYFRDDDSEQTRMTDTGSLLRRSSGTRRYDARDLYLNAGGDWVISGRDYLSYSATIHNNPSDIRTESDGTQEGANGGLPFAYSTYSDLAYLSGNYALFYRRALEQDRHLELTARASHYDTSPAGWREERDDREAYRSEIDMDNRRTVYSLEGNYDLAWPGRLALDIGLNAYYQQAEIRELATAPFRYREGREYLYGALRSLGKGNLSYSASLGLDIVERSASGVRKAYVNVLPSLSLAYKVHKGGSVRLSLSRQRVSPGLGYLNPLNTSTDSLYVTVGNPYLSPSLSNRAVLSYSWSGSPIYLQPSLSYTYEQDRVTPYGRLDGDVYTRSYRNTGHAHLFRASLTARLNLGKYGNINVTPFLSKQEFPGMAFNGRAWGVNGNAYLSYKRVYLNGMLKYTNYQYTQISRTQSGPMVDLEIGWMLPKGWTLSASIRDNMHYYRVWTIDGDYRAYEETIFKDRRWTPMVGLSYYFRNKAKVKYRDKKKLYDNESDSFKLEVN